MAKATATARKLADAPRRQPVETSIPDFDMKLKHELLSAPSRMYQQVSRLDSLVDPNRLVITH